MKINLTTLSKIILINNEEYKFFVVDTLEGYNILSGWDYKEDALDSMNEFKDELDYNCINSELKVYTRRYLESIK